MPAADASDREASERIREQVARAAAERRSLAIRGGGTRDWLLRPAADSAESLDVTAHAGIVAYEPAELVITARAGTTLAALEATLAEQGQMLPFEPPRFGAASTVGGAVASGLSGPRRPWSGAVRDLILGAGVVNGRGEHVRFGGQVMKNVAGYDAARLMAGAYGTLGVLLDVSLKVLPQPEVARTRVFELDADAAQARVTQWARQPLPLAGTAWLEGRLHVRLEGTESGVAAAERTLGGTPVDDAGSFWAGLRDLAHPFFVRAFGPGRRGGHDGDENADERAGARVGQGTGQRGDGRAGEPPGEGEALWRLSLPPTAPWPELPGRWLVGWAGAERWCATTAPAQTVFDAANHLEGHALRIAPEVLRQPLAPAVHTLHQRLKAAFDPQRILNPDRLYAGL